MTAVIVICRTPSGQYFAQGGTRDCAVPTLLVGDAAAALLNAHASRDAPVIVDIAGSVNSSAQAVNVVARLPGPGPLTVVTTPTSAWTSAAGERGPGVALWLGLLRRAAANRRGNWLFAGLSGHELGGAGARAFVAGPDLPPPSAVGLWCHLGASIAARHFIREKETLIPTETPGDGARLLTGDAALLPALATAFNQTVFAPAIVAPADARGELRLYLAKGYTVFGFEGSHDLFHAPGDTAWASSSALLAPIGVALDRFFASRQI